MLPVSGSRPREKPLTPSTRPLTDSAPAGNLSQSQIDNDVDFTRTLREHHDLDNGTEIGQNSVSASAISSPSSILNYASRKNRGDVVLKFNIGDEEQLKWANENGGVKWQIKNLSGEIPSKLKFMFQKSRDMALTMDSHTTNLGSIISKEQNLDPEQSLKDSATEDSVYTGRIRSEGKMTAGSVYFEGNLESNQGHVVSLDLSQLQEYFLFPGEVLALKGRNSLGKCVTVGEIIAPNKLPFSDVKIDASEDTHALTIFIAAGPFTPSNSFDFDPVLDLADVITTNKPDICIIMGPFLPEASYSVFPSRETFDSLIQKQMKILEAAATAISCHIIFVANHKDVHHHFTYPTPPYESKQSLCVPDPSVISIGGVAIGLSSTDILMHLSKTELAKSSSAGADRMARLSGHLLSQRNFYPLYPPDESLPLDVEHWYDFAQMTVRPHIMVLPSELRYFIKEVDGTVVINPQHITKGQSGGFYARLRVQLPSGGYENGANSISEFIKADIVKI